MNGSLIPNGQLLDVCSCGCWIIGRKPPPVDDQACQVWPTDEGVEAVPSGIAGTWTAALSARFSLDPPIHRSAGCEVMRVSA